MKKTLLLLLLISQYTFSQADVVYDPTNASHLLTVTEVLEEIDKAQKELSERLKSAKLVTKFVKYKELLSTLESIYCTINDLDTYQTQLDFDYKRQREPNSCGLSPTISTEIEALNNYLNQLKMATSSNLLALNERTEIINSSYEQIKDITKELNEKKARMKKKVDFNKNIEKSLLMAY